MGLFGKFKKKKDLDFEALADKEFNDSSDPLGMDDAATPGIDQAYPRADILSHRADIFSGQQAPPSSFQPQQFQVGNDAKDLELINSKLDTLKAILSSIDRRLEVLERQAGQEQKNRLW